MKDLFELVCFLVTSLIHSKVPLPEQGLRHDVAIQGRELEIEIHQLVLPGLNADALHGRTKLFGSHSLERLQAFGREKLSQANLTQMSPVCTR